MDGAEFRFGAQGDAEMLLVNGAMIYDGQPLKEESWLQLPDGDSEILIAMKNTTIWLKTGPSIPIQSFLFSMRRTTSDASTPSISRSPSICAPTSVVTGNTPAQIGMS